MHAATKTNIPHLHLDIRSSNFLDFAVKKKSGQVFFKGYTL